MVLIFIFIISLYFIMLIKFSNSIYYHNDIDLKSDFYPDVSIIVSARNEQKNIKNLINSLLKQNYPINKFQILIANDRSTDNTKKILSEYEKQKINIKILNIEATPIGWSNKKWALSQLIDLANSEIILQIDADCTAPPNWIKSMAGHFVDDKVGFVCGASPLIHNDKLLNNLFEMESLIQESINAGAILNDMVVSCTGRNIAFRKTYFKQVEGYAGNEHISSGDDDLLLQKIAMETNCVIKYSINSMSLVESYAPPKFADFVNQRLRFGSKALLYYKLKTTFELKAVSILIYLVNIIFLISIVSIFNFNIYSLLVPIAIKIIADFLISIIFILKVKRNWSLKTFLILTAVHPIYVVLFGVLGPLIAVDWKK